MRPQIRRSLTQCSPSECDAAPVYYELSDFATSRDSGYPDYECSPERRTVTLSPPRESDYVAPTSDRFATGYWRLVDYTVFHPDHGANVPLFTATGFREGGRITDAGALEGLPTPLTYRSPVGNYDGGAFGACTMRSWTRLEVTCFRDEWPDPPHVAFE